MDATCTGGRGHVCCFLITLDVYLLSFRSYVITLVFWFGRVVKLWIPLLSGLELSLFG